MTDSIQRCMIVPTTYVTLARRLCQSLAPGNHMFTAELSSNSKRPASHYISAGLIDDVFAGALSNPMILYQACSFNNIEVTLEECTDLLANSHIGDGNPFELLHELGLVLVNEAVVLDGLPEQKGI